MPTSAAMKPFLASLVALLICAAPAAAAPVTVEAETLALAPGTGQAASGALKIWSTATATGSVTSRASKRITVRARGEQCVGAPRMIVSVDGRTALDVNVSATSWTDYAADLPLNDGTHALSVRFDNDYRTATCDRNLLVDRVQLTSVAARPLPGAALYVDPHSQAQGYAAGDALIAKIAGQPQAFWFGDWSGDVQSAVGSVVSAAAAAGRVPALVAYDIPQRDCGSYSAGGSGSADAYRAWIRAFAAGIAGRRAIVVLEPDALAGMDCLNATDRATRASLLADAVRVLSAQANTYVYLDGGHDAWQPVATMASRLQLAGAADAQGFALNVSNFRAQAGLVSYGQQVASALGVAHFVIDTSRNGLGPAPDGAWCNPSGRALGAKPGTPSDYRLDWNLWVKRPGESDGTCNGGPVAGAFWPAYADGLAQRAAW
jgi:endoglucanase